MATKRLLLRAAALTGLLVLGTACGGSSKSATSNSPAKPAAVANIPAAGSVSAKAPPQLPPRNATMPTDTIPLVELYQQGQTDVVR
jgi:hypothetical protein